MELVEVAELAELVELAKLVELAQLTELVELAGEERQNLRVYNSWIGACTSNEKRTHRESHVKTGN